MMRARAYALFPEPEMLVRTGLAESLRLLPCGGNIFFQRPPSLRLSDGAHACGGCGPGPRRPCAIRTRALRPANVLWRGIADVDHLDFHRGRAGRIVITRTPGRWDVQDVHAGGVDRPSGSAICCEMALGRIRDWSCPSELRSVQADRPSPEDHHLRPLIYIVISPFAFDPGFDHWWASETEAVNGPRVISERRRLGLSAVHCSGREPGFLCSRVPFNGGTLPCLPVSGRGAVEDPHSRQAVKRPIFFRAECIFKVGETRALQDSKVSNRTWWVAVVWARTA